MVPNAFERTATLVSLQAANILCICKEGCFSESVRSLSSLRSSSPTWASEASLARTRERAAKPRGAEERRACNDLS